MTEEPRNGMRTVQPFHSKYVFATIERKGWDYMVKSGNKVIVDRLRRRLNYDRTKIN